MQNFTIKKRPLNLGLGVVFAWLAIYLGNSMWAYFFAALSVIAAAYTDEIVRFFVINLYDEVKLTDSVKIEVRDKDGNIKDSNSKTS